MQLVLLLANGDVYELSKRSPFISAIIVRHAITFRTRSVSSLAHRNHSEAFIFPRKHFQVSDNGAHIQMARAQVDPLQWILFEIGNFVSKLTKTSIRADSCHLITIRGCALLSIAFHAQSAWPFVLDGVCVYGKYLFAESYVPFAVEHIFFALRISISSRKQQRLSRASIKVSFEFMRN